MRHHSVDDQRQHPRDQAVHVLEAELAAVVDDLVLKQRHGDEAEDEQDSEEEQLIGHAARTTQLNYADVVVYMYIYIHVHTRSGPHEIEIAYFLLR